MKDNGGNELRDILGKLLGVNNVPEDCVVQAILNDQRLQKLAEYDLTKGYTNLKIEAEQLQEKFAEFKHTVITKSSTLAELETTVFSRWGVLEKQRTVAPASQTNLPDLSNIEFTDRKPVTGFASTEQKQKGKKHD